MRPGVSGLHKKSRNVELVASKLHFLCLDLPPSSTITDNKFGIVLPTIDQESKDSAAMP
jgi:hypothetical protein